MERANESGNRDERMALEAEHNRFPEESSRSQSDAQLVETLTRWILMV